MVRIDNATAAAATAASLGLGTTDTPTFQAVAVGGITPASTARFAGMLNTAGAPPSGTFLTDDFVIDVNGVLWICTAGGTPGTWAYAVPSHGQVHAPGSSDPAVIAATSAKASDQTTTSATPADVTSVDVTVPGAGTYEFSFYLPWNSSNTAQGLALQLKSSGAPTNTALAYAIRIQNTTTTHNTWPLTALASSQSTATSGNTGSNYVAEIWGRIVATAGGVLVPQFAIGGGSAATVTIRAGAYGRFAKVGT